MCLLPTSQDKFNLSQKACGNLVPIIYPSVIDRGLILGQCESTACRAAAFCIEQRRFGISSSAAAPFHVAHWIICSANTTMQILHLYHPGLRIYSSSDSLDARMHNMQRMLYVLLVKYSVCYLVL